MGCRNERGEAEPLITPPQCGLADREKIFMLPKGGAFIKKLSGD